MYKRLLAMLLAVCMIFSAVPTTVFATEGQQDEIPTEASLVNDVITCTVTFDAGNGTEPATATVAVGETIEQPVSPAREGYEFTGWYNGESLWDFATPVAGDMTLCAGWQEIVPVSTTAAYKVEHYLQTEEGYELKDTDELEGTIGEDTAAVAKTYEGFVAKEFAQTAIVADGSTVVVIQYDVKVVKEETTTASYKVEHYLQTEEGYELKDTDNLEGTIGEDTAATAKTYEGYTVKEFAQVAIAADGSTVVVIEYDADPVEAEEEKLTMSDVVTVISDKKSTLAPGITQNLISAYDKNGDRVEMYVAVADLDVETVGVYANYKDNQNQVLGMSKTTEQVAAAEAKHEEPYNVVVAINASYYNMTNGKPTGTFIMEGIDNTHQYKDKEGKLRWEGDDYSFFAILKDGTPMIGAKGEYSSYRGQIAESVGGYMHLVKDGAIYYDGFDENNLQKYPRQTVGVTADNKVIIMSADGSQAPRSIGLTLLEQAQVMLALGCVEAVHLDGGGSMTYCAKPEGADTIQILNKPSDGSERSVSNSMMFVSTAAPDGAFHHANVSAEHTYVTPGSDVKISAVGVDYAGGSAEIPAEGITWQVEDAAMGTVENGVFTSSGKAGDAKVQMMYNGTEIGSAMIHVVIPDKLVFNQSTITAPYGKMIKLAVTATVNNGVNEVVLKESDVSFTLSDDAMGTINGFEFTACAENSKVTGGTITALINGTEVTAEATLSLGKGSEVLYDFEDGQVGNWKLQPWSSTPAVGTDLEIVTSETGKIRSGEYAMAVEIDFTQQLSTGYQMAALYFPEDVHIENAQRVGMWVYLPDEFTGLYARYCAYSGPYDPNNAKTNRINNGTFDATHFDTTDTGYVYMIEESGWYYFSLDISTYSDVYLWKDARCIEFYSSDRDGTAFGYTYVTTDNRQINTNAYGKYTLYIDDVTVDYSAAADDREAPVFGQVSVITAGEGSAVLNRLTQASAPHVIPEFTTNTLTINAAVAEDNTWANATGLNEASARCYVDGYEVGCRYVNGNIILDNHYFSNGIHTVRFVMSDNAGNERSAVRKINVTGSATNPTLTLVPADPKADKIYAGSLYYVNLETSALADVENVSVTLDLNSVSKWELQGMEVANGFSATYSYVGSEDGVVINFTRNGNALEDTNVLATIPVRAWYHAANINPVTVWTKDQGICPVDVRVEIDSGKMKMSNGDVITFTGDRIRVDTEIYGTYAVLNANGDYANKTSWHIHKAAAIADKAPTCTEAGYTGRTFCEVCNSVVVWGTKEAATGHTYEIVDGVLKCTCGELFNGVHTDGKTYVDGVPQADGWAGDSYYLGGAKLTGVQKVPAPDASGEFYYEFDETGICAGKVKYTGIFNEDGVNYLSKVGVLSSGWYLEEDGSWYYFVPETLKAADGSVTTTDNKTFDFENGKILSGIWVTEGKYTFYWYGPDYYKSNSKNVEFLIVEIDGDTYLFNSGGVMQTGLKFTHESGNSLSICYDCGTDGKAKPYNGVINDILYVDAYQQTAYKLVKLDGDFYFVSDGHKIAKNTTQYLGGSVAGHTYDDGTPLEPGYYDFGPDGKMVVRNGVYGDYLYVNNVRQTCYKLVKLGKDFYFVNDGHKIARNTTIYLGGSVKGHTFEDGTPLEPGYYDFGADGKMVVRNGVYGDYLYINNVRQTCYKLMKYDGEFYFINDGHKIARNTTIYLGGSVKGHTFADGTPLEPGYYDFGADGKMVIRNGVYGDYLYINNVRQTCYKLVEYAGDLYFVSDGHKIAKNTTMYLSGSLKGHTYNGIELEPGLYDFDENGKMVLRNGVYDDYLYINNVRQTCYKLVKYDGAYYFINDGHKIAKNTKIYMNGSLKGHTDAEGNPLKPGYYEFGADGKMILP